MRSTWAVAVNTIKQALRMKIALTFIILLAVLLPIMAFSMTGDGTIRGRCQTFVSYGLSLTSMLLCLLTIIACAYSVTSDIEQKQIYTTITKPIRRHQYLLGKLLGVMLLDAILLVLFCTAIYGITVSIPRFSKPSQDELNQLNNEFFTARAGLMPAEPNVSADVRKTYNRLEKTGQIPPEVLTSPAARKNYMNSLAAQIKASKFSAVVGQELTWEFYDVRPLDPNQRLFVRFKYEVAVNPPDLQVYGRWLAGDYRQLKYGLKVQTPIYTFDRKDLIRTFYEIEVPADAVADDGFLGVGFLNAPPNDTVVIFTPQEGLEILYKADTFTANFFRAAVLIFLRLVFLGCLSLFASTFLSFPVAILLCLAIFSIGTISSFVVTSFDYLSENISFIYSYTAKPVMKLLPEFDTYNPTKFLVQGRLLSWLTLAKAALSIVCFKALLLLVFALLIFKYREIAKVTV